MHSNKSTDYVGNRKNNTKTLVIAIRLKPTQLGLALDGLKNNFKSGEYDSLSQIVKSTFLHGLDSLTKDFNHKEISTESKQKLMKISKLINWND